MKFILPLLFIVTTAATGQTGKEIITMSAEKIKKLNNITYNIYSERSDEKVTADVTIQRGDDLPVFEVAKIKVSGLAVGDSGSKQIFLSYNGSSFDFVDPKSHQYIRLDSPSYRKISRTGLLPYTLAAVAPYWQKEPFQILLSQMTDAEKMEDTVVYGTECFKIEVIIEVKSQLGEKQYSQSHWFIGKKDFLVYGYRTKVDRQFLRITSIDRSIEPAFFSLTVKKELKKITGLEPLNKGLLTIGTTAPAWTLPSSMNKPLALEDLRGKVVLLDFWGTWCVPCLKAMPDIQAIYEEFKSEDVEVIGVSVEMEKHVDPIAFMKKKGFTYPIVLEGHTITESYRVQEFPTIYLIDKESKIIHAEHSGNRENFRSDLIRRINEALTQKTK